MRAALRSGRSGLTPCDFETVNIPTWIGEVADVDGVALDARLSAFDCRNNRLALMGLETDGFAQAVHLARERYGPARVGVFLGTSTSGILQAELAYRQREAVTGALPEDFLYRSTQNSFSVSEFTREYFQLQGMAVAVSTACSSSAKVFAAAARHLAMGTIDAAIVGGVDSLCLTTLHGFASLQLTSVNPCKPYDADRDGISIGEGAAFALLERSSSFEDGAIVLVGAGESSDAYHMSAPHPQGLGARMAMQAALRSAQLSVKDIGYINLHGTSTLANDSAEGMAVQDLFGQEVACSSTKGATGHTLGAAGALEVVICAMALQESTVWGSPGTEHLDPAIAINYTMRAYTAPVRYTLTNSFGFGGSNCSLVLGVQA